VNLGSLFVLVVGRSSVGHPSKYIGGEPTMPTTKPTDEYDQLLDALRKICGVPNVERESVRMINDHVDEETGERVKIVEYRFRMRNDVHLSDIELKAIHSLIGQAAAEVNALKKL
jgi:hypothetical protein